MTKPLVFLSAPYTNPDQRVTEHRVACLLTADAHLMKHGIYTVSPVYKHLLVRQGLDIPGTWDYWKEYCRVLMRACSCMVIVPMPGWENSPGVAGERDCAAELNIPVYVYDLFQIEDLKVRLRCY